MYSVNVDRAPTIIVNSARHQVTYAVDGSAMNPLEGFYATLAGCAAVYAKKACKELGISPEGIHISCKPFAGSGGPLTLARFKTEVAFPEGFSEEHKAKVMEAVTHCAVKNIVETGSTIDFPVNAV